MAVECGCLCQERLRIHFVVGLPEMAYPINLMREIAWKLGAGGQTIVIDDMGQDDEAWTNNSHDGEAEADTAKEKELNGAFSHSLVSPAKTRKIGNLLSAESVRDFRDNRKKKKGTYELGKVKKKKYLHPDMWTCLYDIDFIPSPNLCSKIKAWSEIPDK